MDDEKKEAPSIGKTVDTLAKSIRGRKKTEKSSTQRFLPIAEIRNDIVYLKNGGARAILEVEAMNFNLKSETEQRAIIAGYAAFVNTLAFPLQIVVRSTKIDIDAYIERTREQTANQPSELLKKQTVAYLDFIKKIVDIADIMQKKFYVVIPVDHAENTKQKPLLASFFGWMSSMDDTLAKVAQRGKEMERTGTQLQERIELIKTGLENIGLPSRRLTTHDLIELFYQVYNPAIGKSEKLPGDIDTLHIDKTAL